MSSFFCALPLVGSLFSACAAPAPFATGYVEGDYVLIAPVASARITSLAVHRGDHVAAGAPLAEMERSDADIGLAEAKAALDQARATLANLQEGRRPEEIRVIEAALASARAQQVEAVRTADRIASLAARDAASPAQRDDAVTALDVARARVAEAEANLAVARLPARPQEIAAAEAMVEAAIAARDRAQWALDQRHLTAPATGRITDVLREAGEIAAPGTPVIELLPDGALKLRLYVPETLLSSVHQGTRLAVHCDGCAPGLVAEVSYIASGPEYTPPVIYSLQNRQKLVYMIEARLSGDAVLAPGQIVDADLVDAQP